VRSLPPSKPLTGPAPHRRSVCAPERCSIPSQTTLGNGHGTVAWVATYDGPNPPELTSVAGMSIAGTFRNPANFTFRLEFFATPNERDQGKTFFGAPDVATAAAGHASFTFSPPGGVPANRCSPRQQRTTPSRRGFLKPSPSWREPPPTCPSPRHRTRHRRPLQTPTLRSRALPLAVVLETPPAHGVLALAADGSFTYTLAAGFSGSDTFTYSASDGVLTSAPSTVTLDVAAAPPSRDTIGPCVTALRRFGFHAQPTFLVASFDAALDAAAAANPNNYRLVDLGPYRRLGTRDDRARSVRSASYDAATRTVTLAPRNSRLVCRRQYELRIAGEVGGASLTREPASIVHFGRSSLVGRARDLTTGSTPVVSRHSSYGRPESQILGPSRRMTC
jgi:Bacterial Ig domain